MAGVCDHYKGVGTFYTSDQHFGHTNIIGLCDRPFRNADEMGDYIMAQWNSLVGPTDTVWVLGDVALGNTALELERIKGLNGVKHLVAGNHDRCWEHHKPKRRRGWLQRYLDAGFVSVSSYHNTTIGAHQVGLCHFPYQGDSHPEDRYREYRPIDRGGWLIHGHIHEKRRVDRQGRMINVGVDVWGFKPVPESVLETIINNTPQPTHRRKV